MKINIYNFKDNPELSYLKMLECQNIIDENLTKNGGPLRQEDLLLQLHDWHYLLTATIDDIPVGLSLVRKSHEDKHNTGANNYFYISLIAVLPVVQRNGIGTELLKETLSLPVSLPIVASCRKDNEVSKHFLSNSMTNYNDTRRYHRFIDSKKKTEIIKR
ncbi:MAG: GNAT family N-acetyltransferase [Firmicutes bacterium]|nr:GNAT family N-acetyltransferase [Bacillota bacterium]